jgi:hypothetical protein
VRELYGSRAAIQVETSAKSLYAGDMAKDYVLWLRGSTGLDVLTNE